MNLLDSRWLLSPRLLSFAVRSCFVNTTAALLFTIVLCTSTSAQVFDTLTYQQEPALGFCPQPGAIFSANITFDRSGGSGGGGYVLSLSILQEGNPLTNECRFVNQGGFDCLVEVSLPTRVLTAIEASSAIAVFKQILTDQALDGPGPDCPISDSCIINAYKIDDVRVTDSPCNVRYITEELNRVILGLLDQLRDPPLTNNGDTNGDGRRNISDAVYVLVHLFLSGPAPVKATCPIDLTCPMETANRVRNGDTNGDGSVNIADATGLLNWLFGPGNPPVAACVCPVNRDCSGCSGRGRCLPQPDGSSICSADLATSQEVEALYEFLAMVFGNSCTTSGGCRVADGHCGIGLGGCYYALNDFVNQSDLNALAEQFELLVMRTDTGVCDCPSPPISVDCKADGCELTF